MNKLINQYTTEIDYKILKMEDILKSHVQIEKNLEYCKVCPIYNKCWACPPFNFSVKDIWEKYSLINIIVLTINYSDKLRNLPVDLQQKYGKLIIEKEKLKLLPWLYNLENTLPQARLLNAGTCTFCELEGGCAKLLGKPCRHPEYMRYSIEALGGNVVSILDQYFSKPILWTSDGTLPESHSIVFGIMFSEEGNKL